MVFEYALNFFNWPMTVSVDVNIGYCYGFISILELQQLPFLPALH